MELFEDCLQQYLISEFYFTKNSKTTILLNVFNK